MFQRVRLGVTAEAQRFAGRHEEGRVGLAMWVVADGARADGHGPVDEFCRRPRIVAFGAEVDVGHGDGVAPCMIQGILFLNNLRSSK